MDLILGYKFDTANIYSLIHQIFLLARKSRDTIALKILFFSFVSMGLAEM